MSLSIHVARVERALGQIDDHAVGLAARLLRADFAVDLLQRHGGRQCLARQADLWVAVQPVVLGILAFPIELALPQRALQDLRRQLDRRGVVGEEFQLGRTVLHLELHDVAADDAGLRADLDLDAVGIRRVRLERVVLRRQRPVDLGEAHVEDDVPSVGHRSLAGHGGDEILLRLCA